MSGPGIRYSAFLSYSHAGDKRLASALQAGLHRFARQWNQIRSLRIFRDESSLSAHPHLWGAIEDAMKSSKFFILLASPQAAQSAWVAREIEWWRAHRAVARILIVLTDGEIVWTGTPGEFDRQRTTALPPALLQAFTDEPLYVDLRWSRSVDRLSLDDPRFRGAIADLAAPLHGRPKDDLIGEDVQQHRRSRRMRGLAIAGLTMLAIGLAAAGATAWVQRNTAFVSQSRFLADQSRRELDNGDAETAMLLALEALPQRPTTISRPLVGEAEAALYQAVLAHRVERVLEGHRQEVTSIVSSADGARLLSASLDGTARLWESSTGKLLGVFDSHEDAAVPIVAAFCEPGDEVLTISDKGTANFWTAGRVDPTRTLSVVQSSSRPASSFSKMLANMESAVPAALTVVGRHSLGALRETDAFPSRNCATIAVKQLMAQTVLWDARANVRIRTVGIDVDWPLAFRFDDKGSRLVTRTADGRQLLWDLTSGTHVATIAASKESGKGLRDVLQKLLRDTGVQVPPSLSVDPAIFDEVAAPISAADVSDDGRLFASSTNATARLFDLTNGEARQTFRGHESAILFVDLNADGSRLLTASLDGTARIWNAETGEVVQLFRHPGGRPVMQARFSPDARLVVSLSGAEAWLWDGVTGQQLARLRQRDAISQATFGREGRTVLTASMGGEIALWSAGPAYERTADTVLQADVTGAPSLRSPLQSSATVSPDGHTVVAVAADGVVRVWDADTGTISSEISVGPGERPASDDSAVQAARAELAADGKTLVVVAPEGIEKSISVWDIRTRARVHAIDRRSHADDYAGLASDRRTLIRSSRAGDGISMEAFDAATGARLDRAWRGDFAPDGGRIALSSRGDYAAIARSTHDGASISIEVVDVLRSRTRSVGTLTLPRTDDSISRRDRLFLAVSDDGDDVLAGVKDGAAHVFTGCQRFWGARHRVLIGSPGEIEQAAFGSGGHLVTLSKDRMSTLWSTQSGRMLSALPAGAMAVFAPGGRRFITDGGELWDAVAARPLGTLPLPWSLRLRGDPVDSQWRFVWLPDGARVVASGRDARAFVFPVYDFDRLRARARALLHDRTLTPAQRTLYFLN